MHTSFEETLGPHRGAAEELSDQQASSESLRAVNQTDEFVQLQHQFLRP